MQLEEKIEEKEIRKLKELEVKLIFEKIISLNKKRSLRYATRYAKEGLNLTGKNLKIQVLYILNNIQYWKGKGTTKAKETLKAFVTPSRRGNN